MERKLSLRRLGVALTAALFSSGLLATTPADAQTGGRMRILVPSLEAQQGAKDDFGEDVAEEVTKLIDKMPTHAPVERDELRQALRKFKMKESELDCIKARQLAVQINAELVLCGEYTPQGQVSARFISARTGDAFEVPPFQSQDDKQAAQQIFTAFETYANQLRLAAFCLDYLNSQQWANALENCNKAIELNPQYIPALYGKASALINMDSLAPALATLKQVLELNPVHQEALLSAGIVATRLNEIEQGRGYFHQYMELNPGNVDVRLKVAADLAKEGDPLGALQLLEEGFESAPDNITLREYAGHFALAAAQNASSTAGSNGAPTAEARPLFEKALKYYEEVFAAKGAEAEPTMLRNMMAVLLQLEQAERAVELGARATEARPDDAALWSVYAEALSKTGQLDQAIQAVERIATIDPNYKPLYARSGMWLLQAGRLGTAMEHFRKAVQRQEVESPDAIARNIAIIGYSSKTKEGQFDAAMEYYDAARELATTAETRAMANFFAGYSLYQKGMQIAKPETAASAKQALPIFQRALEFFQGASAYRDQAATLQKLIPATQLYIEIQEALIKRGR